MSSSTFHFETASGFPLCTLELRILEGASAERRAAQAVVEAADAAARQVLLAGGDAAGVPGIGWGYGKIMKDDLVMTW